MDLHDIADEVKGELGRFGTESAKRFDTLEKKHQDLARDLDRVAAAVRRVHQGERPADDGKREPAPETKAFVQYLIKGADALPELERKALTVSTDPQGGYLAPGDYAQDLIRAIREASPIRRLARTVRTEAGSLFFPKQGGNTTPQWVGEVETRPESSIDFGGIEIWLHEMATFIDASSRLLEDAKLDVPDIISVDLGESFAACEAQAFLTGNGVKKPFGLLQNADLVKVPSGASAELTPDGLITLLYSIKPTYRRKARWLMSNSTAAAVRKMKSAADGTYLWQDAGRIVEGEPATLLGYPVEIDDNMPSIGANNVPVLFGDFGRAYVILEKPNGNFTVLRDPYTVAGSGKVRFHARQRVGGALVRPEALAAQRVATS